MCAELIEASNHAKQLKLRLGNVNVKNGEQGTEGAEKRPLDLNSAALAKSHLQNLKSDNYERHVQGIVEYVFNGARLKVFIPAQDLLITVNLSGVQCGRTGPSRAKEPKDQPGKCNS